MTGNHTDQGEMRMEPNPYCRDRGSCKMPRGKGPLKPSRNVLLGLRQPVPSTLEFRTLLYTMPSPTRLVKFTSEVRLFGGPRQLPSWSWGEVDAMPISEAQKWGCLVEQLQTPI